MSKTRTLKYALEDLRPLGELIPLLEDKVNEQILEKFWFTEEGLYLLLSEAHLFAEQSYLYHKDKLRREVQERIQKGLSINDLSERLMSWMEEDPRMRRPVVVHRED